MKSTKITKPFLAVLLALVMAFGPTASSFATTTYPSNIYNAPAGPLVLYDGTSVTSVTPDQAYSWTSSGTETDYAQYTVTSGMDSSLVCSDGSGAPMVEGLEWGGSITAANPDIGSDGNSAYFYFSPGEGSIYELAPSGGGGGGGGGDSDLLDMGINGRNFITPLSIADFNSGGLKAYVVHLRDGSVDYSVTTDQPVISAQLSCDIAVNGIGPGSTDSTPTDSAANSPKTGAGEVLLATFFVVLLASSFVVYKAIEKHRKTAQVSEK